MQISVYTDGGARGNPGISGYGVVIFDEQKNIIYRESKYLGIKTNNEAEYMGFIAALSWIKDHQDQYSIDKASFFADSQLMIRQVSGIYKVKSPNILPLFQYAKSILSSFTFPCEFKDIRREYNKLADELANQAMDSKI